ncbi:MAG TPA: DsbC family protein [Steroidobacteraceae bacterium]|nr:DsbC family protein [Steroidobacteraceae bacterium]
MPLPLNGLFMVWQIESMKVLLRMVNLWRILLLGAALVLGSLAQAQQANSSTAKADPRVAIAKKIDGVKPEDVRASPVPGVFEVTRRGAVAYVASDARYLIAGDLYDLDTDDNLTETRRRAVRKKLIGDIPESEIIVFSPKDPKYTVTVFTDIDCGYCQELHSHIADYNKRGIAIRYLLYPRTGPGSEAWSKAEKVWCSANRKDALTRSKRGETIKAPKCAATVVARDYELGQDLALRGTPAIVFENGDLIPGYLPPAGLASKLQESLAAR